jgi:hypothetical protein
MPYCAVRLAATLTVGEGQEEVSQWLDDEWIERKVHKDIGNLAGKLIEDARRAGDQVRSP